MPRRWILLAVPLVAAFAGCYRPNEPGVTISGRVTYLGKPVDGLSIAFVPDIDKPGRGGQSMIYGGRYTIPPEEGLIPGEFSILIISPEKPKSPPAPDAPAIPERYREMNELRVTVPARKSYSFDFDLKPDPSPPAIEKPGAVD